MKKVFVTQENQNLNYIPAESFGEVVFLCRRDYSPIKNSLNNEALVSEIRSKLKDFDPSTDYIAVSGSPVVAALVFMVLRERTDAVKVLHWSNRDRAYQPMALVV